MTDVPSNSEIAHLIHLHEGVVRSDELRSLLAGELDELIREYRDAFECFRVTQNTAPNRCVGIVDLLSGWESKRKIEFAYIEYERLMEAQGSEPRRLSEFGRTGILFCFQDIKLHQIAIGKKVVTTDGEGEVEGITPECLVRIRLESGDLVTKYPTFVSE